MHHQPTRRPQRGTSLLEALVAFLVLSLGMLAVARVQTLLRSNSEMARERSQAVRLAQQDIEMQRAFAVLAAASGAPSFEAIASHARNVDASTGFATHAHFLVDRRVSPGAAPRAKDIAVTVRWDDRNGAAHQVELASIIAASDPAFSGALGLARGSALSVGAQGRSPRIPVAAKRLGDGRSVFKPISGGPIALVFDDASGALVGRCTGVDAALATSALTAASLLNCDTQAGRLLSGAVRFSSALPPNAAHANDPPPDTAITLALTGGPYPSAPQCSVEAMKTVSYTAAGSLHRAAVAIGATAAALGLPAWTDTGERHLAYHCAVYPNAAGRWSGRAVLVPTGWAIGTAATERRVCRFSSDLDGSGAIDANIEHPASYVNVDASLAQQNFLVVHGDQACPAGGATGFTDLSTAQHQP